MNASESALNVKFHAINQFPSLTFGLMVFLHKKKHWGTSGSICGRDIS